MKNRNEIIESAIIDCLNEIYMASQPSITFDELQNMYKKQKGLGNSNEILCDHFYISKEEMDDIIESYMSAYNIRENWNSNIELVTTYLKDGGTKDKYIKEEGFPGYRGYEKTPKLEDVIGKEASDKVFELINDCKNFYRFDREESEFKFNIFNYGPSNNLEHVREYWKDKGVKIYRKVYNEETDEYDFVE